MKLIKFMTRSKQVNISVTDEEYEEIRQAAERDERKTASWIRKTVLREAAKELGDTEEDDPPWKS